jgi:tetratricopeptide (TPR) repeat protein
MGNVLLNMDDNHLSDAAVWFQKAIEADTRNGVRWQLASDHASYANWFKRKGDRLKARENFQKAIDIFEEGGADGWVNRTQKSLAELV